jgi:thiol-disulfide isomerase/thioredoxin
VAIINLNYSLIPGCFIAILLLTAGCTDTSQHPGAAVAQPAIGSNNTIDRVEVLHFHGDQQCTSCIAVGDLAEETVKEYFPVELASGKVSFRHINYDDPENKDIITDYGVTGSSLWITSYGANGVHRLQDMDVWYLTGDREKYKAYLAGVITKRLNGDLS